MPPRIIQHLLPNHPDSVVVLHIKEQVPWAPKSGAVPAGQPLVNLRLRSGGGPQGQYVPANPVLDNLISRIRPERALVEKELYLLDGALCTQDPRPTPGR